MAATASAEHEIAAAAHPEFAVQELAVHAPSDGHEVSSDLSTDLSSEWEHSLSANQDGPAAELPPAVQGAGEASADASSNAEIAETVEEIRFYLEHFMTDQARAGSRSWNP